MGIRKFFFSSGTTDCERDSSGGGGTNRTSGNNNNNNVSIIYSGASFKNQIIKNQMIKLIWPAGRPTKCELCTAVNDFDRWAHFVGRSQRFQIAISVFCK